MIALKKRLPIGLSLAISMAPPALIAKAPPASQNSFAQTKAFASAPKGDLLTRFTVYDRMVETPKGTDCDWVFVDPAFDLENLRNAGLTLTVASFASHEDGGYLLGNITENPIVGSFRQSIRALGIKVTEGAGSQAQEGTVLANARAVATAKNGGGTGLGGRNAAERQKEAMAAMYRQNPQVLEQMVDQKLASDTVGTQVELDRYQDEKGKLGVDEAAKRAEARKTERRAAARAELLGESFKASEPVEIASPKPLAPPKKPEDRPGYQVVAYIHESKAASHFWAPVATNTTTAEFLLLKDGKPLAAGRHNSVGVGMSSGSGAKCGRALASLFSARP